ncbi:class F sortase [Streptomyces sp. NPDC058664]|uniref:class F sortase n=1 Tax=unclassified Streptomyces TaxID=2593676 RepID=UPI003669D81D
MLLFLFPPGVFSEQASAPAGPTAPRAGGSPAPTPSDSRRTAGPAMPRSAPLRLTIPGIGVDAPFTGLEIGPSGALDPPPADDTNLVGWHASGTSPGERGTAVIAGHVDTAVAPAVFARLGELSPGDRFHVRREDGTTATFVVDDTESFSKDDFPDERVYADTPRAEARLITCSGAYDRKAKDYTENLVVFAHLDTTA